MDLIKISLIGLIAIIAYYLLLQWPPALPVSDFSQEGLGVDESAEPNEIITIKDSKDLLSSLKETEVIDPVSTSSSVLNTKELKTFDLENEVLKIKIDPVSGRFVSSEMKKIKIKKGLPESLSIFGNRNLTEKDSTCVTEEGAINVGGLCLGNYYAVSGFFSEEENKFISPHFEFIEKVSLNDGTNLYVLSGESGPFSLVRKIIVKPNEYSLLIEDIVGLSQGSKGPRQVVPYLEIVRDSLEMGVDESRFATYTYLGPVFSTDIDSFNKISFSDLAENSYQETSSGGWFALIQRYFMSAWIPEKGETYKFQARKGSLNNYSLALAGSTKTIDVNSSVSFKNQLYVGPKIAKDLNKLDPNLGLVVDYGFLWWLGQPMYWLLEVGFKLLGNWGWAILFATIVIRVVLWPLTAFSYKSMAKMRASAPKLQALQAKHASDKQKLAQETMAFYKKEGVNPFGGCLPMLLQMPFFIAFYWVLLDTAQLRHAPFVFWIDDLSSRDPYFVLPVLNGLLMYLSQKFMPITPSPDPSQQQMQQMMKYMPVGICVIFGWFPSGFVLYFTAQTLVQLIQQALNFRKEGISIRSVIFK